MRVRTIEIVQSQKDFQFNSVKSWRPFWPCNMISRTGNKGKRKKLYRKGNSRIARRRQLRWSSVSDSFCKKRYNSTITSEILLVARNEINLFKKLRDRSRSWRWLSYGSDCLKLNDIVEGFGFDTFSDIRHGFSVIISYFIFDCQDVSEHSHDTLSVTPQWELNFVNKNDLSRGRFDTIMTWSCKRHLWKLF